MKGTLLLVLVKDLTLIHKKISAIKETLLISEIIISLLQTDTNKNKPFNNIVLTPININNPTVQMNKVILPGLENL
jgi:hypothetical protein